MPPKIAKCHECDKQVVYTDNGVLLDYPAVRADTIERDWDVWHIMQVAHLYIATTGGPPTTLAHTIHEHQVDEEEG